MDTTRQQAISHTETTIDLVVSKCDYFLDVHLWPLHNTLNPNLWLNNFKDHEKEHAVHLLNSFLFYSDDLVDQLFISAFQMLSNKVRRHDDALRIAQSSWRSFVDTLFVTLVTGEDPNISDSGFGFARKARQKLGINQNQLKSQEDCLEYLVQMGPRPVLFVDDFVGSGNQFLETWERPVRLSNSTMTSFKDVSQSRGSSFFYCPLVCTEKGYKRLTKECPEVILSPAHILSNKYSAIEPDSIIWPEHLRTTAVDFLYTVSARAGIPDNGGGVNDWRGFHKLGLALGFANSIPDATLPIIYWEENGWQPLIKRK